MTAVAASSGFPVLEKYELIEEIGHGGMATVYRARDPRLGREVAVKVIHKHLRENKEVATRFVAEARAAAKLRHPGIVEVFDVSNEDDHERYLVVELLRGTTLRKVLQQHREMPAEVGAAIVLELCEALEAAHAGSVIHRDVKPENVLVELPADRAAVVSNPGAIPSGRSSPVPEAPRSAPSSDPKASSKRGKLVDPGVVIKITDFGIAKILDAQGVTSTGQVLGSPAHMAPEQIEGGEVDARTDVFALGVLMYECLVGHLPFEGKNPAQVLRRVLEGTFAAADRERATVGGRWAKILARALAREMEGRTKTPGALGEEIHAELEAVGITDPKAEIDGYFADPDAYSKALEQRLLPKLLARGEAARRSKDIPGAADDFNRALAFAPNDMAILKRITSLNSGASRRLLAKRLGAIAAGSAALGLATFGVVRLLRSQPTPVQVGEGTAVPGIDVTAPVPSGGEPGLEGSAEGPTAAVSAVHSGAKPRVRFLPGASSAAPTTSAAVGPAAGKRKVRFAVTPMGATFFLNGTKADWTGTMDLTIGEVVSVRVTMPDSKCCKPYEGTKRVDAPPADKPELVQTIPVNLEIVPASVTIRGPATGTFSCAGQSGVLPWSGPIPLTRPVWSGTCSFITPEGQKKTKFVDSLKAGETQTINWPD